MRSRTRIAPSNGVARRREPKQTRLRFFVPVSSFGVVVEETRGFPRDVRLGDALFRDTSRLGSSFGFCNCFPLGALTSRPALGGEAEDGRRRRRSQRVERLGDAQARHDGRAAYSRRVRFVRDWFHIFFFPLARRDSRRVVLVAAEVVAQGKRAAAAKRATAREGVRRAVRARRAAEERLVLLPLVNRLQSAGLDEDGRAFDGGRDGGAP